MTTKTTAISLEKKIYIKCDCYGELMEISLDKYNFETPSWQLWFAIFRHGYDGYKPTWRHRMGHIWHIIKRGHPFADAIGIDVVRAREIRDFLNEAITTMESENVTTDIR